MNDIQTIILGTTIAGLSTGFGAIPIFFKKEFSKSYINIGLGFSAGIMLVASFISLILPAIESAKDVYANHYAIYLVLLSLVVGYLFIIGIHEILPHEHIIKETDMKHRKKLSRVSLIVFAISLHNLPEGLAVGVGFGSGDLSQGMALALAISLQNLPEGLVVAFAILSEGASKKKAFFMALLSGLIEPIAAVFGFYTSSISVYSLPIALSFAGGCMLFVICQEILPELFGRGHDKKASLGVITGVITMLLIDFYF